MSRRVSFQFMAGLVVFLVAAAWASPASAQHHGGHSGLHLDIGHHGLGIGIHGDYGHGFYGHGYVPWHNGLYYDPGYHWYAPARYGYYYAPVNGQQIYHNDHPAVPAVQSPQAPQQPTQLGSRGTAGDSSYQRRAEEAFRSGNYNEAQRLASHALVETPRDGKLHLFMGQALFAVGDYQAAAAAIHRGMSLLESKDWGDVVTNFRHFYTGKAYVQQMEGLNDFVKKNPDAAYARFVRGYQYGFLGHKETAIRDLTKAYKLESRDELAARLVTHFGGTVPAVVSSGLFVSEPDKSHNDADHNHRGNDHGSHRHGGQHQDGHNHNHGEAALPKPPIASPLLLDDRNAPFAIEDAPRQND